MLILPIVVVDCLRQTNKFAGPIFRIRQVTKRIADGEPVEELRFRDGDFWDGFASDFNRMVQRVASCDDVAAVEQGNCQDAQSAQNEELVSC